MYHIIVSEANISCQASIENELIDVDGRNEFTLTEYLDITECSEITHATSHIEGVEYGSESAQGIGTGSLYFTHDVD